MQSGQRYSPQKGDTMIDEVEVMHEEEVLAENDSYRWEELSDQLSHLICCVDDSRSDCVRESRDRNTSEYDSLESMLWDVKNYVDGRIEELRPGSYAREYDNRYASRSQQEMMSYALQEGINYVGLHEVSCSPQWCKDAIEYISEHGLVSMNYEATCKAVEEYLAVTLQQRLSALLVQKGA